jgi:hypothetical protein
VRNLFYNWSKDGNKEKICEREDVFPEKIKRGNQKASSQKISEAEINGILWEDEANRS